MGWSNYNHYKDSSDDDRGSNDEYYIAKCYSCNKHTEHDRCTDKCVDCEEGQHL